MFTELFAIKTLALLRRVYYYLRVEPMILLKNAKEAAIPGRSEGGIDCAEMY